MIDIRTKNKGDFVWIVNQAISEMLEPKQVEFYSPESIDTDKLAFIILNDKKICYPSNMLFETKEEAEIYATVNFIKLYNSVGNSIDQLDNGDKITEETIQNAHNMMVEYENTHPDKFLYHWMNNVPNG